MQLTIWLILCGAAGAGSLVYRRAALIAAFGLWILLPSIAQGIVTGLTDASSIPSLHPASYLILSIFGFQFLFRWRELRSSAEDVAASGWLIGAFMIGIAATMVYDGLNGVRLLLDQVVCPVMYFYLVRADLKVDPANKRSYINAIIGFSLLEVCFGALQWRAQAPLLFTAEYGLNFKLNAFLRPPGTLDHPLAFALLLVTCIPFALSLRSATRQFLVTVLLLFGLIISQSRAALVVAVLATVFLLSRREARRGYKLFTTALGIGFLILYFSGVFSLAVAGRFQNDAGSTGLRTTAWMYFVHHLPDYVLLGKGLTSNFTTLQNAGLDSSLENPVMMYTFDVGLVFTICYFLAIFFAISWKTPDALSTAGKYSAVIAFITVQTYSSIATQSAASIILWLAVALASSYPLSPDAAAQAEAAEAREPSPAARTARTPVPLLASSPMPPVPRPKPHQRRTVPLSGRAIRVEVHGRRAARDVTHAR